MQGPLRVAAYVDRYPPSVMAGAETMLHTMLAASAAAGHRVDVVTAVHHAYVLDGVHVWPRGDLARLRHADVMAGHLMWTREAVEFAAENKVPLVYLVHNDRQLTHWKLSPDNVTMVAFNSSWVADRWVDRWQGPHVTIRPPVNVDAFRDAAGGDRRREFVTLVNPNPDKGAAVLYALAASTTYRFLAVEGAYGHQVRPGDDSPNVTWQPHTPDIARDVYARTRVLLVPSRYESWGRVAVEAAAAGIPVIAHPTHGLEEAMGDAAIWCNRDYPAQWRHALGVLDDPGAWQLWSERSSARAVALAEQSAHDLALWDRTLRLAASARRVRSAA